MSSLGKTQYFDNKCYAADSRKSSSSSSDDKALMDFVRASQQKDAGKSEWPDPQNPSRPQAMCVRPAGDPASSVTSRRENSVRVADLSRPGVANSTSSASAPAFYLRFEGQDRGKVLQDTREEIEALLPVVQGLRSQKDQLSPQAQATLHVAEGRLQEQMNYYALASDSAGSLRASGLIPAGGSFELNLRIAEAFRKGADDFAGSTFTPPPTVLPGQGESQSMSGAEIAHRLRALAPQHADALIDNAISITGMPHLDTSGFMTDKARANSAGTLGWDFAGRLVDPVDAKDRNWSFMDNFSFGDSTLKKQMDSSNIRYLTAGVESIATAKLSKTDLAAVHYRGEARLGAKFYAQDLPAMMYTGAGLGLSQAVKSLGSRQIQDILRNEGPEGLADALSGAGKRRTGKAGGNWPISAPKKSPNVVKQESELGCGAACAEMALADRGVKVPQNTFGRESRPPVKVHNDLNKHLPGWKGAVTNGTPDEVRDLSKAGSWVANMRDWNSGSRLGHFVIVDGVNEAGGVMIRDPWNGYSYTMKMKDFTNYWTWEAIFKP